MDGRFYPFTLEDFLDSFYEISKKYKYCNIVNCMTQNSIVPVQYGEKQSYVSVSPNLIY